MRILLSTLWLWSSLPLWVAEPNAPEPTGALLQVTVQPPQVTLADAQARQQLIVLGTYADGRQWDLTRSATYTGADAAGVVRGAVPQVTVTVAGKTLQVPVQVQSKTHVTKIDFSRNVEPILTKAGCNQGACHGAQHGRGGFRLSLLGFDPLFDYTQMVQSAEGRRVVLSDPERSILLAKPVLAMEHGGGEKLKINSADYATLRQWLAEGAAPPSADDPTVQKIVVYPPARTLVPGEAQQLAVTAIWSDGRREDVTPLAQYDALSDTVAKVTPTGLVMAQAAGETHIMVRFGGQATVAQVTLPFARIAPYPALPKNNFIDEKLQTKWQALGLVPAQMGTDAEFYRRIHLDTIGTLPEPAAVQAFLKDTNPNKRAQAIEVVLQRGEFVDYWAIKWGDLLRIHGLALEDKGMWQFYNWVRASLRDQKPVDQFTREIILAEGSTYLDGPANFYRVGRTPEDWSETTAQLFLGVRLQCAKCHHHPFEKWSQDDYYGLTAYFARLTSKVSTEFGIGTRETVLFLKPTGEVSHPRTRKVVKPHPLDGAPTDDPFDRRRQLAEWITQPTNPFFARNMVNRFWGYYLGRGLVEPLDDLRATNPASNPELLDALAADWVAAKFDLKHLLRRIMNSAAYQLGSTITPGNQADATNTHFTRYTVKRLSAEQMADAVDFATGTREKYPGLPLGTRAIQLPDPRVRSYLLDVFGRPPRQTTCECERSTQPNLAQALHLLNGEFLNKKITDPTGRVEKLIKAKAPTEAAITELYLVTLSRPPHAEELSKSRDWLARAPSPREGLQDLLWVLLNAREFLFNH
jgi:hypothetical protein